MVALVPINIPQPPALQGASNQDSGVMNQAESSVDNQVILLSLQHLTNVSLDD